MLEKVQVVGVLWSGKSGKGDGLVMEFDPLTV